MPFIGGSAEGVATFQVCGKNEHVEDIWTEIPQDAFSGDEFEVVIMANSSGDSILPKPSDSAVVHDNIFHNHTMIFGKVELKLCCPEMVKGTTRHLTFAVASNSQATLCYMFDNLRVRNFLVSSGNINASSTGSYQFFMSFWMRRKDIPAKNKKFFASFYIRRDPELNVRWRIIVAVVQDVSLSEKVGQSAPLNDAKCYVLY